MTKLCIHCRRGRPVLRAQDLLNPYLECVNCGATFTLPAIRYQIRFGTILEYDDNRVKAIGLAKRFLKHDDDVVVVTDRWEIEKPLVFKKDQVRTV